MARAHALKPKEVEIAYHLALVYKERGKFKQAMATLKRVENVFTLSDRLIRHIKRLKATLGAEVGHGA